MIGAMPVPSRRAVAALHLSLEPPASHLRRARAGVDVALSRGARGAILGTAVDPALGQAPALQRAVDMAVHAAHDGAEERAA